MASKKSILFVCRENVGRSQAAACFARGYTNHTILSAGIQVDSPGQKLIDNPHSSHFLSAMDELGFNLRNSSRSLLTPDMMKSSEVVIILAEVDVIPTWITEARHPRMELWDTEDMKGLSKSDSRYIIAGIRDRVESFLNNYTLAI